MKKYQTPMIEEVLLEAADMILASGDQIVSVDDQSQANQIVETTWDDSWN